MAHLLIVDDDPDVLKLAEKVLTHAGHVVMTAQDAIAAIDLLNRGAFDVLISDANMPLYSGFQLVQTVRADRRLKNMAVAMLTGLKERKDVEKAVRAGVDDYIVKPLDPLLLMQKVESLISKRPPQEKPEIRFSPGMAAAAGHLAIAIEIESISELGVTLLSPTPLPEGFTVDLTSTFLAQWNEPVPPLKVLIREPVEGKDLYRTELVFLGAPESLLKQIRRWIFSHGSSNKAAA